MLMLIAAPKNLTAFTIRFILNVNPRLLGSRGGSCRDAGQLDAHPGWVATIHKLETLLNSLEKISKFSLPSCKQISPPSREEENDFQVSLLRCYGEVNDQVLDMFGKNLTSP